MLLLHASNQPAGVGFAPQALKARTTPRAVGNFNPSALRTAGASESNKIAAAKSPPARHRQETLRSNAWRSCGRGGIGYSGCYSNPFLIDPFLSDLGGIRVAIRGPSVVPVARPELGFDLRLNQLLNLIYDDIAADVEKVEAEQRLEKELDKELDKRYSLKSKVSWNAREALDAEMSEMRRRLDLERKFRKLEREDEDEAAQRASSAKQQQTNNRGMKTMHAASQTRRGQQQHLQVPDMKLSESIDSYLYRLDMQGIDSDDISLALRGNVLQASGKSIVNSADGQYYSSSFKRSIVLPTDADLDQLSSQVMRNGELQIHVKKIVPSDDGDGENAVRRIEIEKLPTPHDDDDQNES